MRNRKCGLTFRRKQFKKVESLSAPQLAVGPMGGPQLAQTTPPPHPEEGRNRAILIQLLVPFHIHTYILQPSSYWGIHKNLLPSSLSPRLISFFMSPPRGIQQQLSCSFSPFCLLLLPTTPSSQHVWALSAFDSATGFFSSPIKYRVDCISKK